MIPSPLHQIYKKYERWVPILFFFLGFIFDAMMLRRIDEFKVIIQQALYLFASGILIGTELIEETREIRPPRYLSKVWKYREAFLHFLMGTLLNSYTIFYFKSASTLTSFIFIALLITLLTLNEFKRFGKSQIQVHVALLSLCLISYLVSLTPIMMGFMGHWPFLVAAATSAILFLVYYKVLARKLVDQPRHLRTQVLVPFAAIQILFVILYFSHLIPPVPLSVKYMGIYHQIEKSGQDYELSYTRSAWKFWQHGDQSFAARKGDQIFCYAQIFCPTRFKDELHVRWMYFDSKRGWVSSDAIPLTVVGGREEGYRAVTKKGNYQPGSWRVQIETRENQVVGRIGFQVTADESNDERELHKESR